MSEINWILIKWKLQNNIVDNVLLYYVPTTYLPRYV